MELFDRLFENLLVFVYHCFDRVVINGYLFGSSSTVLTFGAVVSN